MTSTEGRERSLVIPWEPRGGIGAYPWRVDLEHLKVFEGVLAGTLRGNPTILRSPFYHAT